MMVMKDCDQILARSRAAAECLETRFAVSMGFGGEFLGTVITLVTADGIF
jgi:hypothetical protein